MDRASREDITRLLELHAWEFAPTARPQAIARIAGRALLQEVVSALEAETAPRFTLFVGRDTNRALIGGVPGLHWHTPQFAPDDPPPGGAIVFERRRNRQARFRLTVHFRSQTLDEMRNLSQPGPEAMPSLTFSPCDRVNGCTASQLRTQIGHGRLSQYGP